MKHSILSIILLALIISLTVTVASSANLNTAYAIENYLKLRSANVNHTRDIDADIKTEGNIPSEKGKSGFGYAILTDVGDEFLNNVLVAITDIGIKNYDESENDKLNTYILDLTGDISRACSGSDYEVARSSSDNEAFDTNYNINVKGNRISIDDIDTDDLDSDTVKVIASFTAEAITHNGKIQHVCIDIQDVLKQSEINTSYDTNNNNNGNGGDDDYHDKSRHKDNDKNRKEDHDDDAKKNDYDNDDNDLFRIDINQDIDQSNECGGSSTCNNEGDNTAHIFGFSDSEDDSEFESSLDIDQNIDQSNICSDEAICSNEGSNELNFWGYSDDDSGNSDIDISQSIEQNNECDGGASCTNEGSNEANVFGSTSNGEDIDIDQSIEQSNTCSGGSVCRNFASNVANIS
jgi:hypothetical protein